MDECRESGEPLRESFLRKRGVYDLVTIEERRKWMDNGKQMVIVSQGKQLALSN